MTREEAINIIRDTYHTDTELEALKVLIPELSESEDERIRKFICSIIDNLEPKDFVGVKKMNVIAWLEKQKYDRMKPIYDAKESFESALEKAWNDYHNGYENVDKLEDDYVECAHAKGFREGYLFGIEKQKEQKPAEDWREKRKKECPFRRNLDNNLYGCGRYADVVYACDGICSWVADYPKLKEIQDKKEQKPEWSEDFEENIRNLLHDKLTGHSEDGTMTWTTFIDDKTLRDIVNGIWFYVGKEALKYPNKELNVAEWSEEDEDKLMDILEMIKYTDVLPPTDIPSCTGHLHLSNEYKEKLSSWLKSLRPQPKRKQSLALKKIVDNMTEEKLAKTRAEMKTEE